MAGSINYRVPNEEGISTRNGAFDTKGGMPRPTKSGVIGPPKVKMQNAGGDAKTRMSNSMPRTGLGRPKSPLPKFPFNSMAGTQPSLLQSRSPMGLEGIK